MTKNFIPLLDFELTYFNGGMFAPFINSENSVPAARPAAAPSNSFGKDMAIGAISGGGMVAATTGDPRLRVIGTVGGGLMGGLIHCFERIDLPTARPVNLAVEAVRHPSAPTYSM